MVVALAWFCRGLFRKAYLYMRWRMCDTAWRLSEKGGKKAPKKNKNGDELKRWRSHSDLSTFVKEDDRKPFSLTMT